VLTRVHAHAEAEQQLLEKQKVVEDVKESEKAVKPAMEAVLEQKAMQVRQYSYCCTNEAVQKHKY
jgi:hypothetical protein